MGAVFSPFTYFADLNTLFHKSHILLPISRRGCQHQCPYYLNAIVCVCVHARVLHSHFFCETPPLNLELRDSARLVVLPTPEILSLSPWCWDYRVVPFSFLHGCWGWTPVLILAGWAVNPLSHLIPQLLPFVTYSFFERYESPAMLPRLLSRSTSFHGFLNPGLKVTDSHTWPDLLVHQRTKSQQDQSHHIFSGG